MENRPTTMGKIVPTTMERNVLQPIDGDKIFTLMEAVPISMDKIVKNYHGEVCGTSIWYKLNTYSDGNWTNYHGEGFVSYIEEDSTTS